MRDDVNGAGMPGIERQRLLRNSFGALELSVLLEGEGVHPKNARITRNLSRPVRQHFLDAVAHHAPPAKVEVERVCDRECEDVVRPVDEDGVIKHDRTCRIVVEPSARGHCMKERRIASVAACQFDRGDARGKRRSRSGVIGAHDECGTQTMPEYGIGVIG